MTMPLLFVLDGNTQLQQGLQSALRVERGDCLVRRFPDGESYVRVLSDCRDRDVIVLCSLSQPDQHTLPLFFLADTLRELGARSVGLVAPYLGYMRQDTRFHPGEAISSKLFARYLSERIDWLVTVDPHLHRYHALNEIYSVPHQLVHAAPLLATYIAQSISRPLLIGPDSESEQWVAAVAAAADAPFQVLHKTRHGDRDVSVSVPDTERWRDHTPVLVDDIISTGHTLIETIGHLKSAGLHAPVCMAVHGIFAEDAHARLLASGVERVVTCNSVAHATNAMDLGPLLADAIKNLLPAASGSWL